MPIPKRPLDAIFPIVLQSADPPRYSFRGTGFFLQPDGTFMTAKHVVDAVPLSSSLAAVDTRAEPPSPGLHLIEDLRLSPDYDIAIGRIPSWELPYPLELSETEPALNADLITLEFSQTSVQAGPDGLRHLNLVHSARKGHVVRGYVTEFLRITPVPTHVLELSFPPLRGASGASVVAELRHPQPGAVVGLLVANVERHLMPAQVERIEDDTGVIEERRYFLPLGLAISWRHLRSFALDNGVLGAEPGPSSL